MRTPIVAANWKMNGNIQLLESFAKQSWNTRSAQVIWGLPSIYLVKAKQLGLSALAAQDVSAHEKGAYTGELSAEMLQEVGCEYVILGHSERRSYHQEDEALLVEKCKQLKKQGLKAIYCIGESLEEYENQQTDEALKRQLDPIIEAGLLDEQSVIAYEPVWAIGTGNTATLKYAQTVHAKIRNMLKEKYATIAPSIRILYGGSVKADNASQLFSGEDIDGFLVGGASLEIQSFQGIIEAIS